MAESDVDAAEQQRSDSLSWSEMRLLRLMIIYTLQTPAYRISNGAKDHVRDASEEEEEEEDEDTSSVSDRSESQPARSGVDILSPMPYDLLSNIALQASQTDFNVPLTLGQVNRQLRSFVTCDPLLWAAIDIMFPLRRVALHIERSAGVLLDVSASLAPMFSVASGEDRIIAFIELLSPHCVRIRGLRMVYLEQAWLHAAIPLLSLVGSELQTLDLGLAAFHMWSDETRAIHPAPNAVCRPTCLRLEGSVRWSFSAHVWSRVVRFELRVGEYDLEKSPRLGDLVEVLRCMPVLETLKSWPRNYAA